MASLPVYLDVFSSCTPPGQLIYLPPVQARQDQQTVRNTPVRRGTRRGPSAPSLFSSGRRPETPSSGMCRALVALLALANRPWRPSLHAPLHPGRVSGSVHGRPERARRLGAGRAAMRWAGLSCREEETVKRFRLARIHLAQALALGFASAPQTKQPS